MEIRDIKAHAQKMFKKHMPVAILGYFIASLFGAVGGGFSLSVPSSEAPQDIPQSVPGQEQLPNIEEIYPLLIGIGIFVLAYFVFALIIGSVVSLGYAEFNLDLVDGFTPKIKTLFSHFHQIKTSVCASLLVFVKVFFGMFLFIIPGIIAAYRYSMVYYIIAENPGITAKEALERSKELMRYNKWKFFCLELSFIGWDLLEIITLGIAAFWVEPYRYASHAAFYREAK